MRICSDATDLVHQGPSAGNGIGREYLGRQRVVEEVGILGQCSDLAISYQSPESKLNRRKRTGRTWRKNVMPFWPSC
jgi:hypothetical protein